MDLALSEFKSIFDLLKAFPDEQSCINHLEALRWSGNVISPFDETSTVYKLKNNRYKCRNSNKYFNVRTGTMFEDTKLPLQKWFMALYVFSSHKKGISSHQLAKDISCTQKTAWFVLHRLRYAFNHPAFRAILGNVVEIDETFVGGEEKNKHGNKKTEGTQGRSTKTKKPVLGLVQRAEYHIEVRPHKVIKGKTVKEKVVTKESRIYCQVIDNTQQNTIMPIVSKNVVKGSEVCTDEHRGYGSLKSVYKHSSVNHGAKEYVNGMAHTNGVESFWSHMKRGIDGIYHWVSKDHLQAYVDEFALRYNTRKMKTASRFDLILANVAGKRMTYKQLVGKTL